MTDRGIMDNEGSSSNTFHSPHWPSDKEQSQKTILPLHSSERARRLVPLEVAIRYQFLPMSILSSRRGRQITIAGDSESLHKVLREIEFVVGEQIRVIPYRGTNLQRDIELAYHGSESRLLAAAGRADSEVREGKFTKSVEGWNPRLRDFSDSSISEFVASLVEFAIARCASDLHLTPSKDKIILGLRIGKEMHILTDSLCERMVFDRVVARLKILAGVDPSRKLTPLDGGFPVDQGVDPVLIRFSSLPTIFGERVVLRIGKSARNDSLDCLGLDLETRQIVEDLIVKGSGLSLLVGPTGSGKTTTLYSILRRLVDVGRVVISIEDPVERWIEGVSQASLNEAAGLTFGVAARAVLRQGPDTLVIGEIRDSESAQTAVKAALSGHLVLSTIHARCVFEAIERLAALVPCRLSELSGISAVVAQRLVQAEGVHMASQPPLHLATQTLVISPELQRLLKRRGLSRGEFYQRMDGNSFLPFASCGKRMFEAGIIGFDQYRTLAQLDR